MLRGGKWKSGTSSSEKTQAPTSQCVYYPSVHFISDKTFAIPTSWILYTKIQDLFPSYQKACKLGEVH